MGRRSLKPKERIRRFWQRVDTSAGPDGCWAYKSKQDANGFIHVLWEMGDPDYAHRIAYRLSVGDIPDSLRVLHTCDNRACVNPKHLCLGTMAESQVLSMERVPRTFLTGDGHPSAKLLDAQIDEIRRRYAAGGVLQRELADEYGVHYSLISLIVRGKRRQHAA
jgi:hypothetical protein